MKYFFLFSISLQVCFIWSCNGNSGKRESASRAEEADTELLQKGSWTAEEDANFIGEAYQNNLEVIRYTELAVQDAQTVALKNFASQSVAYYKNLNEQIGLMAQKHAIPLQSNGSNYGVSEEERQGKAELQEKSGEDFEKAFLDNLQQVLQKQRDLFEEASEMASDINIRNWADKITTNLQSHITAVEELEEDI